MSPVTASPIRPLVASPPPCPLTDAVRRVSTLPTGELVKIAASSAATPSRLQIRKLSASHLCTTSDRSFCLFSSGIVDSCACRLSACRDFQAFRASERGGRGRLLEGVGRGHGLAGPKVEAVSVASVRAAVRSGAVSGESRGTRWAPRRVWMKRLMIPRAVLPVNARVSAVAVSSRLIMSR